jgi:hypothetical protein
MKRMGNGRSTVIQRYVLNAFTLLALLCLLPGDVSGLAHVSYGPWPDANARQEYAWLTPLLRSPHRVVSIQGNGGTHYFYRSGAEGLNALLKDYAAADIEKHEVSLWPNLETTRNLKKYGLSNPPVEYNAYLKIHDGFSLSYHKNETLYPTHPRLNIFVSDVALLNELEFPPTLDVVHPANRLLDISRALYDQNRSAAVRYLRDIGPDAEPFRDMLERPFTFERNHLRDARLSALEALQPNGRFQAVSNRILEILDIHQSQKLLMATLESMSERKNLRYENFMRNLNRPFAE